MEVRCFRRILLRAAIATSLLLCVAATVLYIRSYSGTDYLSRSTPGPVTAHAISHHEHQLAWTRGEIRFSTGDESFYPHDAMPMSVDSVPRAATWSWGRLGAGHVGWEAPPAQSLLNRMGFRFYHSSLSTSFSDSHDEVLTLPAWVPVALFAIPPALLLRRRLRTRRRARSGRCPQCDYDLRATPDRCPECGAVPP
jgi:hypothetical protein